MHTGACVARSGGKSDADKRPVSTHDYRKVSRTGGLGPPAHMLGRSEARATSGAFLAVILGLKISVRAQEISAVIINQLGF